MTGMFEWIDPWAVVERAERMERDWYEREDDHRSQMRGAALAFADASHMMRAQMEAAWDPIVRAAALQPAPPLFIPADQMSRFMEIFPK